MRRILPLLLLASGCATSYRVDGALIEQLARPPSAVRAVADLRRVDGALVEVRCEHAGDYGGTVAGAAGTMHFRIDEPSRRCGGAAAVDRVAEQALHTYWRKRGAIAAERLDGTPVWLRADSVDFSSVKWEGDHATVKAHRLHPAAVVGPIVAAFGLALGGASLYAGLTGGSDDQLIGALWGSAIAIPAVLCGGILTLVGALTHWQEVDGGRGDRIYFGQ